MFVWIVLSCSKAYLPRKDQDASWAKRKRTEPSVWKRPTLYWILVVLTTCHIHVLRQPYSQRLFWACSLKKHLNGPQTPLLSKSFQSVQIRFVESLSVIDGFQVGVWLLWCGFIFFLALNTSEQASGRLDSWPLSKASQLCLSTHVRF